MSLRSFGRLAAAASLVLLPALSHAQLFRAYLSAKGSDANPCTVDLPCRLLPQALTAVADRGEVWMLDSANFNAGTVTISKNVTIMAVPGVVGSIVAAGGTAAIATSSGASVKLRNVVIATNAFNPGTDGIVIASGTAVSLEDSVVDISASNRIAVSIPAGGTFSASNTTFRGVQPGQSIQAAGTANVDVTGSRFYNVLRGVYARNGVAGTTTSVAVTGCVFSNVAVGVYAISDTATGLVKATVSGSTFAQGGYGIIADSNSGSSSVVTVAGSTFSGLTSAGLWNVGNTGAAIESAGTNTVRNNAANTVGTITPASPL